MSVIIKGMDLPVIEPNSSIKMQLRNINGKISIGIMTGGYSCCEQWEYFPVAEIEKPHGNLIDRDEVYALMTDEFESTLSESAEGRTVDRCQRIIDSAEVVLEREG